MKTCDLDEIVKVGRVEAFLAEHLGTAPVLGLVSGTGLGGIADAVSCRQVIEFNEIPHFPCTSVQGHKGRLVAGQIKDLPVCLLEGRVHYYEGVNLSEVVFPVRCLADWGISNFLIMNSAGAIRQDLQPGDLMLIEDHLNLIGENPLRGPNQERWGTRFPDMSAAYNADLGNLLKDCSLHLGIELKSGVYAAMTGPSFETPAEIRMLRNLGADAVGMSTVPEVIALRHMGKNVVGISCISNMAAGLSPGPLTHQISIHTAEESVEFLTALVSEFCYCLHGHPSSVGENNA